MSFGMDIGGSSRVAELGRYTLLFRFAAGGMAEVFVGKLTGAGGFEKAVAIKRMLPALAEETRFVDMFLDEARIAANIASPNVVATLDVDRDQEGAPYIVMDLVVGASLSQLVRGSRGVPIPIPIVVELIAQAAQGLHDAHHATRPTGEPLEIVHRDVSPQNILVGVDGRARLMDFGVARALERVTRTQAGEVKGKLSYFSPEQARAEAVDARSDVFALGVVLWELLTGRRLFQREGPMPTLRAVMGDLIVAPSALRGEIPEALDRVVLHALTRDLPARTESAAQLAAELRACGIPTVDPKTIGDWVEQVGGTALTDFRRRIAAAFAMRPDEVEVPVDTEPQVDVAPPTSVTRALTPAAEPQPARSPWPRIGAAMALAVAVLLGVRLAVSWRDTPPPPVPITQPTRPSEPSSQPARVVEVAPEPTPTPMPTGALPGAAADVARPVVREAPATPRRDRPREAIPAREPEAAAPASEPLPPATPSTVTPPPSEPPSVAPAPRRLLGLDQFRSRLESAREGAAQEPAP